MRKTYALIRVATALMAEPEVHHWGYRLSKASGIRSGVLYPILTRLLDEGWLADGWEDQAQIEEKRPARRYYQLTDEGRTALTALLDEARRDARFDGIAGL